MEAQESATTIYKILRAGANPDATDVKGRTAMDIAMEKADYDTAELLLDFGAKPPVLGYDPNGPAPYDKSRYGVVRDIESETALTYYVKKAHSFHEIFKLLANGADVNKPNDSGVTPMEAAVQRGWPYMAAQLARYGAYRDPAARNPDEIIDETTGATRLLVTVLQGKDARIVQAMLEEGASPGKADRFGLTPLAAARALHWPAVEKMLLEKGADPEVVFPDPNQLVGPKKDTPLLSYAVSYQSAHSSYKLALLEAGADPNQIAPDGKAPIHWAAIYTHGWLFDTLKDFGADVTVAGPKDGYTTLHWAALNGAFAVGARVLADCDGELINRQVSKKQSSPLHLAAGRKGAYALVARLINAGGFVNLNDAGNETPLHAAINSHDPAMVRLLIERGGDAQRLGPGYSGNHPLFELANVEDDNRFAIAKMLLDRGADPNMRGDKSMNGVQQGDSLIYYAIRYSAFRIAEAVLKAGADPHGTAANGRTAFHHCLDLRRPEGVKLLLENGFDVLREFDYMEKWHGSGSVTEERHQGSVLDHARKLVEKFGHDSEYGQMLDMIEAHVAATTAAFIPLRAKRGGRKGPSA